MFMKVPSVGLRILEATTGCVFVVVSFLISLVLCIFLYIKVKPGNSGLFYAAFI